MIKENMKNKLTKAIDFIKKYSIYKDLYCNVDHNTEYKYLPFLTSKHISEINNEHISNTGYTVYFTSGTTSKPKEIYCTKNDFNNIEEYLIWFNKIEGYTQKETVLVFMDQFFWGIGNITSRGHVRAGNRVVPVDTDMSKSIIRTIVENIKPTVISSVPSVIIENIDCLSSENLKFVETTGEPLSVEDRKFIEHELDAEVYDSYGLSESLIGVECRAHDGYHFNDEYVFLEIINDNGDILPGGEWGELVVTSFFHEMMPIIKYRTGDICKIDNSKCSCGDLSRRIFIRGRKEKGYSLYEGYELPHSIIISILKDINNSINLESVNITKDRNVFVLNIEYTSKDDIQYGYEIYTSIQNTSQEIIHMIKKGNLKINICKK